MICSLTAISVFSTFFPCLSHNFQDFYVPYNLRSKIAPTWRWWLEAAELEQRCLRPPSSPGYSWAWGLRLRSREAVRSHSIQKLVDFQWRSCPKWTGSSLESWPTFHLLNFHLQIVFRAVVHWSIPQTVLSAYYMPATVPVSRGISGQKRQKFLLLWSLHITKII